MIEVRNMTKRYGKLTACDNISLRTEAGSYTVLLGPNGAGKSTLIKCICGLLRFDGSVTINGFDNHSTEAKRLLGYVPEIPALYPLLTVYEHMVFIARAYKLKDWEAYAEYLLQRFELSDKRDKLGKELSKGMQQKLSICAALVHRPQAIIFDEPLVGLDPHAIRELKILMTELKQAGCTLLVSTHMIESVEDDWDTTCIMMNGRIARSCKRSELAGGRDLEGLYFDITEGSQEALR